jgi:DNA-binding transcriptional MocR family regulator
MTLPEGLSDVEIAARAARDRLWLWPLSPSYFGDKPRQGFVLGFGSTPTEQMARAVRLLGSVLSGDPSLAEASD